MYADSQFVWKKFRFENEMSKEVFDAWLRKDATVKYFLSCARDLGFVPKKCAKKRVRVRYGSRNLGMKETFWSLNVGETDVISVMATEGEPSSSDIDALCAMGFDKLHVIRALRESENDVDDAVQSLLSQSSTGSLMNARDFLLANPNLVNHVYEEVGDDFYDLYQFLNSLLLDPLAFPLAKIFPFSWGIGSSDDEGFSTKLKEIADRGNLMAQKWIAETLLAEGKNAESARYYKLAADQGDAGAQFLYGDMLTSGKEIPQDIEEGTRYLKMAADQGNLGGLMLYGKILSDQENYEEASRYFKVAADQGYSEGQYDYAICLHSGDRVKQHGPEIFKYLQMSAEQGYERAQAMYCFFRT